MQELIINFAAHFKSRDERLLEKMVQMLRTSPHTKIRMIRGEAHQWFVEQLRSAVESEGLASLTVTTWNERLGFPDAVYALRDQLIQAHIAETFESSYPTAPEAEHAYSRVLISEILFAFESQEIPILTFYAALNSIVGKLSQPETVTAYNAYRQGGEMNLVDWLFRNKKLTPEELMALGFARRMHNRVR